MQQVPPLRRSKAIASLLAVAFLLSAPVLTRAADLSQDDLLITDATLVTLTDAGVLAGWSLWIREGKIAEIAPKPRPHWPRDVPQVDGTSRFVMPALYDLHVHIFDERDLEVYALLGVAALRNMDGWGWHLDLAREYDSSAAWRARLSTTGSQVQAPAVETAAEIIEIVSAESAQGFDWIKAYDNLSLKQLEALNQASEDHRIWVTGHLPDDLPVHEVLATGAFSDVAHIEELLPALRSGSNGAASSLESRLDALGRELVNTETRVVTTLVNHRMIVEQVEDLASNLARPEVALAPPLLQAYWRSGLNPYAAEMSDAARQRLLHDHQLLLKAVLGLHTRGVGLLAGTDSPNPTTVPATSLFQELELLVSAGLKPMEAIRTATVAAADHLGETANGRIAPGAQADFLILDADPGVDIRNLRQSSGVVLGGRYRSSAALTDRLEELKAIYAAEAEVLARFDPGSAAAVLQEADDTQGSPTLSREALTSLVWFYSKIQNPAEARAVATRLASWYPSPATQQIVTSLPPARHPRSRT